MENNKLIIIFVGVLIITSTLFFYTGRRVGFEEGYSEGHSDGKFFLAGEIYLDKSGELVYIHKLGENIKDCSNESIPGEICWNEEIGLMPYPNISSDKYTTKFGIVRGIKL